MEMSIIKISLEEAIKQMEKHHSGSVFTDYAKSFRIFNGIPLSKESRKNKRNQSGMLLKINDTLGGVAVTSRYEMHGKEIFSEWRTIDEVAVVWVPQLLRNKGLGTKLFKNACLHLVEGNDPAQWIYVRAVNPVMQTIVERFREKAHLANEDYGPEVKSDFLFDVRSQERRNSLSDYCKNSNFYMPEAI